MVSKVNAASNGTESETIGILRKANDRLRAKIVELERMLKRWDDRKPKIITYMQALEPVVR